MVIEIPMLKLESEANKPQHWAAKARRVKRQKTCVVYSLMVKNIRAWVASETGTIEVTITRIGPRRLDDDNATISAKAVRDAIAYCIGIDDGDCEKAVYKVQQETGKYGVRIEFARRAPKEKAA